MDIIRGTTPSIVLKITNASFSFDDISQLWVTFKNRRGSLGNYEKTFYISDCLLDDTNKTITIKFTQKDTLEIKSIDELEVQIRILFENGDAVATGIKTISVERILKEGVISNE